MCISTAPTFLYPRARATLGSIPRVSFPGYSYAVYFAAAIALWSGIGLAIPLYTFVFAIIKLANLHLDEDIEDCLGLVLRSTHVTSTLQLNYRVTYNKVSNTGDNKGDKEKKKNERSKFTTSIYTLHTRLLIQWCNRWQRYALFTQLSCGPRPLLILQCSLTHGSCCLNPLPAGSMSPKIARSLCALQRLWNSIVYNILAAVSLLNIIMPKTMLTFVHIRSIRAAYNIQYDHDGLLLALHTIPAHP